MTRVQGMLERSTRFAASKQVLHQMYRKKKGEVVSSSSSVHGMQGSKEDALREVCSLPKQHHGFC